MHKYIYVHIVGQFVPLWWVINLEWSYILHIHERSVIGTRQSKATTPEDNSLFLNNCMFTTRTYSIILLIHYAHPHTHTTSMLPHTHIHVSYTTHIKRPPTNTDTWARTTACKVCKPYIPMYRGIGRCMYIHVYMYMDGEEIARLWARKIPCQTCGLISWVNA